ncbi:MAG: hypothetical protein KAT71_06860 [Gammaproteobacteria bacterium]|nr:hypothetical protein [Gammaproteobacteria bacterium]
MYKRLAPLIVLIFICSGCFASEKEDVQKTEYTKMPLLNVIGGNKKDDFTQFQNLTAKQKHTMAKEWGLSPEQYTKYLYYINYTPDATTVDKNTTSPLLVLAMHAQNKAQYDGYIKQAVIIEHNEMARFLQVQHDFTKMVHQLYPKQYPITASWMKTSELQAGDVVQLFCNTHNQTCSNVLGAILPKIRKVSGARIDIFAVNKPTATQIVEFGKKNKISKKEVQSKKVTLNFGDKAFNLLEGETHKKLSLPFIVVRRNGKEVAVNLGDRHGA